MTKSILLADDSVTIQKVVELTFSEGDYRIVCVSNGKAAIQKVQEDRPDILLCDVIMPETNGYEVAAFVKKNPAFSAIPVILLTGTFEPFDEEKARQSGAETYITKPFDSRMLVEKVEELLGRKPTALPAADEGPVQVFHSRTEFTLGQEPRPAAPPPQEGESAQEHGFLGSDHEFPYPEEVPAVESTANKQAPADEAPPQAPEAEPKPVSPPQSLEPLALDQPEVVDLGSMREEDALADSGFDAVLPPATPKGPPDVELPPLDQGPGLTDLVTEPEPPPVSDEPPRVEPPPAVRQVEAGPFEAPSAEEPVATGEEALPAEGEEPVSVSGAEDWGQGAVGIESPAEEPAAHTAPVSALDESASALEIVHDMTDQQEMVSEAQNKQDQGVGETVEEESPFLPEEGVETALSEVPVEAAAPLAGEATQEASLVEAAPPPAPPTPPPPAALQPTREEVEASVRRAMEDLYPAVAREVAAALAPAAIADAVRDLAPTHLRQAVQETLPDAAQKAAAEAAPEATRQAAAEQVAKALPGALQDAVREVVAQLVREMAPEVLRQVAWEVIPELAESLIRRRIQELESESG